MKRRQVDESCLRVSSAFSPNMVNVHVNHPPEASVQVHQVSQLDNYHSNGHQQAGSQQTSSSSSNGYSYHHTESSQKIQHSYNIVFPGHSGYHTSQYQPPISSKDRLGRCFQETTGAQVPTATYIQSRKCRLPLLQIQGCLFSSGTVMRECSTAEFRRRC